MNMLKVLSGLGLTGSLKTKLLKMGIPAKEMEGVDFNSMQSLNQFAARIVPNLLRNNPNVAKQIKESGRLEGDVKKQVDSVIDSI